MKIFDSLLDFIGKHSGLQLFILVFLIMISWALVVLPIILTILLSIYVSPWFLLTLFLTIPSAFTIYWRLFRYEEFDLDFIFQLLKNRK